MTHVFFRHFNTTGNSQTDRVIEIVYFIKIMNIFVSTGWKNLYFADICKAIL